MGLRTPAGELELAGFQCFAAGFSGRDRAAAEHHLEELAAHGVARPASIPICFPVLPQLMLVDARRVTVYGGSTSGEIEPVILLIDGEPR